jgi:lipopolysaccharide export LptBFGC system permease protein LptF
MRRKYKYDMWAQMLAPFACLVITLFAIPAGIASGRQSVFKGILGALGSYFAFYALTILFMIIAKNGWCPPVLAAALPPAVFLALGIRSFFRQR